MSTFGIQTLSVDVPADGMVTVLADWYLLFAWSPNQSQADCYVSRDGEQLNNFPLRRIDGIVNTTTRQHVSIVRFFPEQAGTRVTFRLSCQQSIGTGTVQPHQTTLTALFVPNNIRAN